MIGEYEVDWTARADKNGKPDPLDCSLEPHPRCPYCGHVDTDTCDLLGSYFAADGDECDSQCGKCEQYYEITLHVTYSYSTAPARPAESPQ